MSSAKILGGGGGHVYYYKEEQTNILGKLRSKPIF